jgi:SAM-dependent methyltransferase
MMSVLDQPIGAAEHAFMQLLEQAGVSKPGEILYTGNAIINAGIPLLLERRWYASLEVGVPDYTIYDGEDYLAECWACWRLYSRRYLQLLQKPMAPLAGLSVAQHIGPVAHVLDLGCGIGYTSAALLDVFPGARVTGTNIAGAVQTAVGGVLARSHEFTLVSGLSEVPRPVSVIFASEYFEHFQDPVSHLEEILALEPRVLLIANTFTNKSTGHFVTYSVTGKSMTGEQASRAFNATLRRAGYAQIKTGFWNSRPTYWRKS